MNRHLTDFGVIPLLGYMMLVVVFAGFSAFFFYRLPYPGYLYALAAISVISTTAEGDKVLFLKQHFDTGTFRQIRLSENLLLVLPFALVLLVQGKWIIATGLIALSLLLALTSFNRKLQLTIPTPFYRYPFEFLIGFRKHYLLLLVAIFLQVMAVRFANGNLALFAIGLVCFVGLSFYMAPEHHDMVWIHAMAPERFLWHKIRIALWYGAMLCVPFLFVPAIFFPAQFEFALLVFGLGLVYIITALLGKYAFFPSPMNLPQGITLAMSFWFPPLLMFLLPYFYRRAVRQLKPLLA